MKKRIIVLSTAALIAAGTTVFAATGVTNAASAPHPATAKSGLIHRIGGKRADGALSQAVRDGTITAAQKAAFRAEVKTLRTERKSAITSSSTAAQKQAERATLKSELQAWASTNSFPLAKIFPKLAV